MSIIQGSSVSASSTESGGLYDFPIEQSLRFDGSSYLSRTSTSSSTDNNKYTMSMWIKKIKVDVYPTGEMYLSAGAGGTGNFGTFFGTDFHESSKLSFTAYYGSTTPWYVSSASVQRDTSSWYHYVVVMDQQNSTLSSRIKIYINGVLDSLTVGGFPDTTHTSEINDPSTIHNIGRRSGNADLYFSGYMANFQFIDGQALNAHYFGELKNGVWTPKAFDGTASDSNYTIIGATSSYGTNGFHLQFNPADFNTSGGNQTVTYNGNSSTLPDDHVADVSGSGNHWELH